MVAIGPQSFVIETESRGFFGGCRQILLGQWDIRRPWVPSLFSASVNQSASHIPLPLFRGPERNPLRNHSNFGGRVRTHIYTGLHAPWVRSQRFALS
jgi:hypothetical protein